MKEREIDGKTYVQFPVNWPWCTGCAGSGNTELCRALQNNDTDPCFKRDSRIWITKKDDSVKTKLTDIQKARLNNSINTAFDTCFNHVFDFGEKDDLKAAIDAAKAGATEAVMKYFREDEKMKIKRVESRPTDPVMYIEFQVKKGEKQTNFVAQYNNGMGWWDVFRLVVEGSCSIIKAGIAEKDDAIALAQNEAENFANGV